MCEVGPCGGPHGLCHEVATRGHGGPAECALHGAAARQAPRPQPTQAEPDDEADDDASGTATLRIRHRRGVEVRSRSGDNSTPTAAAPGGRDLVCDLPSGAPDARDQHGGEGLQEGQTNEIEPR